MCHGEEGRLWVHHDNGEVVELDCTTHDFSKTGRVVQSEIDVCFHMCYLSLPHNALVLREFWGTKLQAFSCDTGAKVWEVDPLADISGDAFDPSGFLFSPQYQLLLVADRNNPRFLALNPWDGSHMRVFRLPTEVGNPQELGWFNNKIVLVSYDGEFFLLSTFTFRPAQKQ